MIRSIHIQNFKSLADAKVDLAPFTVLVGNNGSGKSSFLQAIELLSWVVKYESIDEAISQHHLNYRDLVYLHSETSDIQIQLEIVFEDRNPLYSENATIEMTFAKKRYVYLQTENVFRTSQKQKSPYAIRSQKRTRSASERPGKTLKHENVSLRHSMLRDVLTEPNGEEDFRTLHRIAKFLESYIHYEIWGPEKLREPSDVRSKQVFLGKRGDLLANVITDIRGNSDSYRQLMDEIQSRFPSIEEIGIRLQSSHGWETNLYFVEKTDSGSVEYLPSQMSDGFMRLLALLAIKYQPTPLSVMGYEEPENGLHPQALLDCVKHLKGIVRRGTQVIVTTHSPYLLNHLLEDEEEPKAELRLVTMDKNHRTQIQSPDPAKIEKARKQGFGIGELWGMLLNERQLL